VLQPRWAVSRHAFGLWDSRSLGEEDNLDSGLAADAGSWADAGGLAMGGQRRSRLGFVVLGAAVALAAVGGSAVGLGAPAWLAGAAGAVSALAAGTVVDRVFHARDERAAARDRLGQVLAGLKPPASEGGNDVLGLLRADRSPAAFRGRRRELGQLDGWCADAQAVPVMLVGGTAGVGKSRLALEFALRLPDTWTAGWLRAGAGGSAVSAVRACGSPAVILVDDADGRTDLVLLLDALAEGHQDPVVRVVLVTRSAVGLRAVLAARLPERHAWIAAEAPQIELRLEGSHDDRARWFTEAVAAFAAALQAQVPVVAERFRPGRLEDVQPMVMVQAQALLAVLGTDGSQRDPRELSAGQVAEALMGHEKRRWRAMALDWEWGSGGPPAGALQEKAVTALALLGPAGDAEAAEVLRRVPELRDAPAERLSAIAAWISALYPDGLGGAARIRPDLMGEWFVVDQLTAHPELAQSLRAGLTDAQAGRALSFLAHAADRMESASLLFDEFASGDIRRKILAAVQAALTGETGRHLLDAVIAQQIQSADGWAADQLAEVERLIPEPVLLRTHAAIADRNVALYRALAAGNPAAHQANLAGALNNLGAWLGDLGRYQEALAATEEAVALSRALAAGNPAAHQAGLAAALNNLGIWLGRLGRYQEALAARTEAVRIYREMASANPDMYRDEYRRTLDALRREYDQRGMKSEAILHDLADPP
jgi:tetratricopeptide (TPR) repeat protein